MQNLKTVLNFISENDKNAAVKLLGGEPTLHREFEKIFELIKSKGFNRIQLFSNGIIPPEAIEVLKKYSDSIMLLWNMNPAELYPEKLNEHIMHVMHELDSGNNVLGCNIFHPCYRFNHMYRMLDNLTHLSFVRLGIAHPIGLDMCSGQKYISYKDYPKVGTAIYKFVLKVQDKYPRVKAISLDCGYVPCMFSDHQMKMIRRSGLLKIHGGCNTVHDVDTELTVNTCFSASSKDSRRKLSEFSDMNELNSFYSAQLVFSRSYLPPISPICRKCRLKINCTGGCRGERMIIVKKRIRQLEKKISQERMNTHRIRMQLKLIQFYISIYRYTDAGDLTVLALSEIEQMEHGSRKANHSGQYSMIRLHLLDMQKIISYLTDPKRHRTPGSVLKSRPEDLKNYYKYKNYFMTLPNEKYLSKYSFYLSRITGSGGSHGSKVEWEYWEVRQYVEQVRSIQYRIRDVLSMNTYKNSLELIFGPRAGKKYVRAYLKIQNDDGK